jgi:hypothetical protein
MRQVAGSIDILLLPLSSANARANADVMQHDDRQSGYVVVLVEDGHAARLKAAKRKRGAADNDREDL